MGNGGGSTDIRESYGGINGSINLESRLVVAGGGGAGSDTLSGGKGGGLIGASGAGQPTLNADITAGSQVLGGDGCTAFHSGSLWKGGTCGITLNNFGGGGGFYGGGGGSNAAGSGGSSFTKGTYLFNVQGDPRCSGDGSLYISPASSMAPTPMPSVSPTAFLDKDPSATSFLYTGAPQVYLVPKGTHFLKVDACGAMGSGVSPVGGLGGFISALFPVIEGSLLYVYVGGFGQDGGYNGGGRGDFGLTASGGGGTDIRTTFGGESGGSNLTETTRLVVAGGGGASLKGSRGGAGGGFTGGQGSPVGSDHRYNGNGGNQIRGGQSWYDGDWQNYNGMAWCPSSVAMNGDLWSGGSCFNNRLNLGGNGAGGDATGAGGGGGFYGGSAGSFSGGGGSSTCTAIGCIILENVQGDLRCSGN